MDNRELALYYLKEIHKCRPKKGTSISDGQDGMKFVLLYLHFNKEKDITAGLLASELNVSTARIAVLLNKLEEKKYILRTSSKTDLRKTLVIITELGDNKTAEYLECGISKMEKLIEYIGDDEMSKFISTLKKITNYINEDGGINNV